MIKRKTLWGISFGNFQPGDHAQNRTLEEGGAYSPSFNVSNKSQVNFWSDLYTLHWRLWTETGEILGNSGVKCQLQHGEDRKWGKYRGNWAQRLVLSSWAGSVSLVFPVLSCLTVWDLAMGEIGRSTLPTKAKTGCLQWILASYKSTKTLSAEWTTIFLWRYVRYFCIQSWTQA